MKSYLIFLRFYLQSSSKKLDGFIGPMLFSITTIVLFQFAYGHIQDITRQEMAIGQLHLSVLLGMFIFFLRSFAVDTEDGFITHIRVTDAPKTSWFLAKLTQVFIWLMLLATLNIVAVGILWHSSIWDLVNIQTATITIVNILGISALGLLVIFAVHLSSIMEIIFSLIFFPLSTPLFLCSIQCWSEIAKSGETTELSTNWAMASISISVILLTISILLIGELLQPQRETQKVENK